MTKGPRLLQNASSPGDGLSSSCPAGDPGYIGNNLALLSADCRAGPIRLLAGCATRTDGRQRVAFRLQQARIFLTTCVELRVRLGTLRPGITRDGGGTEIQRVRRIHFVVHEAGEERRQQTALELLRHRRELATRPIQSEG